MNDLTPIRAIPITEIYNKYINGKLIKRGLYLWTRCHQHGNDSSPSLKIYPLQNSWWCYGCNTGGSQIDLVVHALNISVGEAIRRIKNDYNLTAQLSPHIARQQQMTMNINEQFQIEYDRIFARLSYVNRQLIKLLPDIRTVVQFPSIYHHQLIIDDLLEDMCSEDQAVRISSWRRARKVFEWI